ncbi:MAG: YkgJ family cysteine cluster protein [Thermodesulfobacteriota bacterium]
MSTLREKIVQRIYHQFEQWIGQNKLQFSCQRGCASCCTHNVTMTATEGELIHRFINENGRNSWFADKIQSIKNRQQLTETTNELAQKCLAAEESSTLPPEKKETVCPFLEDDSCQIYEVRPFSCRSFASVKKCRPGQAAELPQYYISATTAGQQLIEHVGQGEYWGNMHDVLLALCDIKENEGTAELLASQSVADQARSRLTKAQPLPGFLIGQDEYEKVSPFILAVFNDKIGEKNVEDILNGK